MEAKELRIGNLVVDTCIDKEIEISYEHFEYADDFESIPLTEEWLLKFGFEFDDYEDYDFGFMSIRKEENKLYYNPISEYYDSMKMLIKYVHQLQNLYFALTGEELTIKYK